MPSLRRRILDRVEERLRAAVDLQAVYRHAIGSEPSLSQLPMALIGVPEETSSADRSATAEQTATLTVGIAVFDLVDRAESLDDAIVAVQKSVRPGTGLHDLDDSLGFDFVDQVQFTAVGIKQLPENSKIVAAEMRVQVLYRHVLWDPALAPGEVAP